MNLETLRNSLADNQAMMQKSFAFDDNTKREAEEELSRLDVRLQSLPYGHVARDDATAYEYRRLLDEKARLLRVIGGY